MNPTPDTVKFPFTFLLHVVGIALFITGLLLLDLSIAGIFSSLPKFLGAAIFYFGCDELAQSGWRSWRQWRVRQVPQTS
jgi:hypothetical protein